MDDSEKRGEMSDEMKAKNHPNFGFQSNSKSSKTTACVRAEHNVYDLADTWRRDTQCSLVNRGQHSAECSTECDLFETREFFF